MVHRRYGDVDGWSSRCYLEHHRYGRYFPFSLFSPLANIIVQSKWVAVWLNKGVHDNVPVIPPSVHGNASQSYSVAISAPVDLEHSILGYGLGWFRNSYLGHDVTKFHFFLLPMNDNW